MGALANNQSAPKAANEDAFAGTLYSWWHGNPLPQLPPIHGFSASRNDAPGLLNMWFGLDESEVEVRVREGNVPYVAHLDGEPAAYGWSAWRYGQIGELGLEFEIPSGNRYLWDFVTLPSLRGRGIYAQLLQEILRMEVEEAERFWIGHEPGNVASSKGILRSGFRVTGGVWFRGSQLVFVGQDDLDRASAAASLLQVPLLSQSEH